MVKKIRFPLEMKDGKKVRSIEELRENFSVEHILNYIENGMLLIWLRDRYEEEKADAIEKLDLKDKEIVRKICEIFDINYNNSLNENLKKKQEYLKKLNKLKQYTDNKEYEKVLDSIAFDQNDLDNLLGKNIKKIYLCGDEFTIPVTQKNITYKGINKPTVVLSSKEEIDWNEKRIILNNVVFDDDFQKGNSLINEYIDNTCINSMVSEEKRDLVIEIFNIAKQEIISETNIKEIENMVEDIAFKLKDSYYKRYTRIAEFDFRRNFSIIINI